MAGAGRAEAAGAGALGPPPAAGGAAAGGAAGAGGGADGVTPSAGSPSTPGVKGEPAAEPPPLPAAADRLLRLAAAESTATGERAAARVGRLGASLARAACGCYIF